jgi:hypothetical protein
MSRKARPEDVDEICGSLPETWFGTSWGDVPTWLVHHRVKDGERQGRGFVLYRKPDKTAVDEHGELYDDLLVVRCRTEDDKRALVEGAGPWFTIDHFRRTNAVLVQLSRLDEITRDELAEVITEAWLACAPTKLAREHAQELGG